MKIKKLMIRVIRVLSIIVGLIIIIFILIPSIGNYLFNFQIILTVIYGSVLMLPYSKIKNRWMTYIILLIHVSFIVFALLGLSKQFFIIPGLIIIITVLNIWAFASIIAPHWLFSRNRAIYLWLSILAIIISTLGLKKLVFENKTFFNELDGYEDNWMD